MVITFVGVSLIGDRLGCPPTAVDWLDNIELDSDWLCEGECDWLDGSEGVCDRLDVVVGAIGKLETFFSDDMRDMLRSSAMGCC